MTVSWTLLDVGDLDSLEERGSGSLQTTLQFGFVWCFLMNILGPWFWGKKTPSHHINGLYYRCDLSSLMLTSPAWGQVCQGCKVTPPPLCALRKEVTKCSPLLRSWGCVPPHRACRIHINFYVFIYLFIILPLIYISTDHAYFILSVSSSTPFFFF